MLARPTACAKAIAVAQVLHVGGSWCVGVCGVCGVGVGVVSYRGVARTLSLGNGILRLGVFAVSTLDTRTHPHTKHEAINYCARKDS